MFVLILVNCSNNELNENLPTTTTTIENKDSLQSSNNLVDETTTTTTLAPIVQDVCFDEDNTTIDFKNLKNDQNFLNRYGFNAGEED